MGHRMFAFALAMIMMAAGSPRAEQKRAITVEDCVRTRRILVEGSSKSLPIQLSQDGSRVAFVVKNPNPETNRNDYQLYIRNLDQLEERNDGKLILVADSVSEIKWIGPNRLIARVGRKSNGQIENEVAMIDEVTATSQKLKFPVPVDEFSVSADGTVIAFSTSIKRSEPASAKHPPRQTLDEHGYAVVFGKGLGDGNGDGVPQNEIYVGKIGRDGKIEASKAYFSGPGSAPPRSSLSWVEELQISPDGKYLLFKYSAESLPDHWHENPVIQESSGFGTLAETHLLALYDIASGQLRLAFNYPGNFVSAKWADDSRAYSVISPSPFGTAEEKKETEAASSFGRLYYYLFRFNHVFCVDPKTQAVTTVVRRDSGEPGNSKFRLDQPLVWRSSDAMLIRTGDNNFSRMLWTGGAWKEAGRTAVPQDNLLRSQFTSDGRVLVGISQGLTTPPDLFVQDMTTGHSTLLTDLNPQYRAISLGEVEKIEWTNGYGSRCVGNLIKPAGYQTGKRYPLVLMANYTADIFISDAQYTTAFAPQPLANAGFVVLMSQYPREDKYPRDEFPGDMGQAHNWMSMMESAIDLLAAKGIVDRSQVGIVGFSRTGWLVDFMLTHSRYKIMAASSADSGLYTYGGYFRYNLPLQILMGNDSQVGGPPYGDTRKYWLEYAPPFNAEKVTAPLLMEYAGTSEHGLEFFVALSRLGKPVDLFRYPAGAHPFDTPFERVASLRRNVDWFRFWIQGQEDNAPDYDPDQYMRWRQLRDQRDWNERIWAEGKDPGAEFVRQTSPGSVTRPQNRAPQAAMMHP